MDSEHETIPRGNAAGFVRYFLHDVTSGFLVFLIALPLCLAIATASGFPPVAGIFTAIAGAFITTFISNSELTIKGPAAGLIVIVIGCITDFGGDGAAGGFSAIDTQAYRAALAVCVMAAVMQVLLGLFRGGILGEFFPSAVVHGMLSAIGVIIMLKQFPVVLGVPATGDPIELIRHIPHAIMHANPAIALIGVICLLIMFSWSFLGSKVALLKRIPPQLVVLLVAIPIGIALRLSISHTYNFGGTEYSLGENFLVAISPKMFGIFDAFQTPDFTVLQQFKAWKWIFMFFAIGSLESMLSAKAVDIIDPWKRKTDLNNDTLAVGVANLAVAFVGGQPMISEIVRSRANIDNGARTRFADLWHGVFLLVCVALIPMVLHQIPMAALAAMLVFTGFRLAHPREFIHVYQIGREQFFIFVATLISVLATDLLIGIGIGVATKLAIHVMNGVSIKSLFKPFLEVESVGEHECRIVARESAVFSNWIPFRRQLVDIGLVQRQNITLDLANTKMVDHSVVEKLFELKKEFQAEGLLLKIEGLSDLTATSSHKYSARLGRLPEMKCITIVTGEHLEAKLVPAILQLGATGFTILPCRGAGVFHFDENGSSIGTFQQLHLETIVPESLCNEILSYLRAEIIPDEKIIVTVTSVGVIRPEKFLPATPAAFVPVSQLVEH